MTFFPPPNPRSPGIDPRSFFAREAEAIVRECLDVTDLRYDPARFALIFTTETGEKCFSLVNVFSETRDMLPEKRRERIAFCWLAAFTGNVRGRPVAIVPERG